MKCKFCNEHIDFLGSFEKECCSWCQQEQPFHHHTCWICESPLEFNEGFAFCENCGKDYLTEQEKTELDELYADFLKESAERISHDYSGKN
jgi:predicted amidophosphoribosyltransferase